MPMFRPEDLPPHLRRDDERPRLREELPLLEKLPPPDMHPRGGRNDEPPPAADPFLRR